MVAVINSPRPLGRTLGHEIRAAGAMVYDSLFPPKRTRSPRSNGQFGLILPGFTAPWMVYRNLQWFMEELGWYSMVGNFGWLNISSLRRQKHLLDANLRKFIATVGRPPDVVLGHSLGGIEGVWLLTEYPSIQKVIAIGSPFNEGTPWRIAELGASLFIAPHAVHARVLREIVDRGKVMAEKKIVTISSVNDRLVPPSHAAFPGARNIIIRPTDYRHFPNCRRRAHCDTHTGLPNFPLVRAILRRELH
ncbi:MAG: hypothetical protein KGZ30_04220 [Anaplasmataceae bacterium]|nr:hypothetical protein [Anaplasmataceae bacterium]